VPKEGLAKAGFQEFSPGIQFARIWSDREVSLFGGWNMDWLGVLPLWTVFFLTIGVVLLSVWVGSVAGERTRRRSAPDLEITIGPIVGALLGLLGFLLAFTFGMAANRYDVRKQLLLDEVNAIGTTYLRAELLPAAEGIEIRRMLREYVDIRANVATRSPEQVNQDIARSDKLLDEMWSRLTVLAGKDQITRAAGLFMSSLNEVIDFHTKRLTVSLQYHIPGAIWLVFYVLTALAMAAVGYHFGVSGRSSILIIVCMAISLSTVILLIADLDRPGEGVLRVDQQPMVVLQQKLNSE
jgi:hypothetical protein